MIAVSNSSPLIALDFLDRLDLFGDLYDDVWIAPTVAMEVRPRVLPLSLRVRALSQPVGPEILRAALGAGESETLALAIETAADLVLLDDPAARRLALVLGLKTSGMIGVLIQAKRRGLIPAVQPLLETLQRLPFHMSTPLYEEALGLAGELPEH